MLAFGDKRAGKRRVSGAGVAALALIALVLPLMALLGSPGQAEAQDSSDWSPPTTVYIPDTGQTIDGVFLDQWRAGGGVSAYGNPITQEMTEDGHTVQYYEYARFEYVPEDPDGIVVHLGNLGEELKPVTVFRTVPAIGSRKNTGGAAAGLANEARAWLPLDNATAAQPDTNTRTYVADTRHTVQNGFKDFWESTGGVDYLGNPISEEWQADGVSYQVFERGKLSWTAADGVTMLPVGTILAKQYHLDTTGTPTSDYPTYSEDLFVAPEPVLPEAPFDDLWIDVNLSSQYLIVYNGNTDIAETYVSTGRPGFDTPTGTFYINSKLDSQTMEGVLGGEYYNVPDVPWVMYFTDLGHALHGTYWHSNFGETMSHGCVNLPMDFAAWLYGIAEVGTPVVIHY